MVFAPSISILLDLMKDLTLLSTPSPGFVLLPGFLWHYTLLVLFQHVRLLLLTLLCTDSSFLPCTLRVNPKCCVQGPLLSTLPLLVTLISLSPHGLNDHFYADFETYIFSPHCSLKVQSLSTWHLPSGHFQLDVLCIFSTCPKHNTLSSSSSTHTTLLHSSIFFKGTKQPPKCLRSGTWVMFNSFPLTLRT